MNDLVIAETGEIVPAMKPLTVREIQEQQNVIQFVLRDVMKDGTHFGTIPGTPNPTLYKPGAEKILSTFRVSVDPVVEDLSTDVYIKYRVSARLISHSGVFLGAGVGECSTNEEKYNYRGAVCDQEFDATPIDRRREKWKRGRGGSGYSVKQVRTEPADLANTVLKMAKKRALIDAVLTVFAASDIFSQDIEDLSDEVREQVAPDYRPAGVKDMDTPASDDKTAIVNKLTAAAGNGVEALLKEWGAITDDERKLVGAEFGRIKKLAGS